VDAFADIENLLNSANFIAEFQGLHCAGRTISILGFSRVLASGNGRRGLFILTL